MSSLLKVELVHVHQSAYLHLEWQVQVLLPGSIFIGVKQKAVKQKAAGITVREKPLLNGRRSLSPQYLVVEVVVELL